MRWGIGRLGVGLILLVACTGGSDSGSGPDDAPASETSETSEAEAPELVASEVVPPEVVVEEPSGDVPPCESHHLRLDHLSDEEEPAPGGHNVELTVVEPDVRCTLTAPPELGLALDGAGPPTPLAPHPNLAAGPPATPVVLRDNRSLVGVVVWRSWCDPAPGEIVAAARLPTGGELYATMWAFRPGCDPAATNGSGAWTVRTRPRPPILYVEDVPEEVEHDGRFRFTVRLHNAGAEDIPLRPCPGYEIVALGPAGAEDTDQAVRRTYTLDCSGAPDTLPAGSELRFTADVPVSDFPHGFPAALGTSVDLGGGTGETRTLIEPPTITDS